MLLETLKKTMTRQLLLEIHPMLLTEEIVGFLESQIEKYPGKTSLRIQMRDERSGRKIGFQRIGSGVEMNDEMTHFLLEHPDVEVNVVTA